MVAMKARVGIIGVGTIGSIIAKRLISRGYKVFGSRRTAFKFKGMRTTTDNRLLIRNSDVILLATKQKDVNELGWRIRPYLGDKLTITLMAGVSISQVERILGANRVARAMTNIAFSDGEAISAFCCNNKVSPHDKAAIKAVLSTGGKVMELEEGLMDSFTVLDSCAMAFYSMLLNSVNVSASKTLGFNPKLAKWIIMNTMRATLEKASGSETFEELIRQVSTKGGMTAAGLDVLMEGDLYGLVDRAYVAALRRGMALSAIAEQS